VKTLLTVLVSILLGPAALAGDIAAKIPSVLPSMPDVKTPAVAPAYVVGSDPTRSVTAGYTPIAAQAKLEAAGDAGSPGAGPDFSIVRYDEPGDGALWVRGRAYKARFDAESTTFIPWLGAQAPRNYPVRVELASIRVGGDEVELGRGELQREGDDVILDRGAIREVWHMGLESAEQTFVLASRPAGDLELRIGFTTELEARVGGDGLEFDGPHGGVRISGAVAVDAAGRRLALATRFEGAAIRIDLPSAFSATAACPIVIDPVYSAYALESGAIICGSPDVSNSGSAGRWCATYTYAYSATDKDVWAQDLNYGQPVAGTGMWIDSTTESWYDPRIAYNAVHDTYVVVSWVYNTTSKIMSRAHYAGTTNQLAQVLVQSASAGDCYYPDIGGDPTLASPTYFFVAWTRKYSPTDFDIHGRLLNWDGTPAGGGIVYIENSSAADSLPRVSKTNGHLPYATQRWNVVWERANATVDVYGAQIGWDGQIVTPAFAIDTTSANDANPSASSVLDGAVGQRPWMVTFARDHGDWDVEARVLTGSSIQGSVNVSVREYSAIYEDQRWPDVDTNGQRFGLTYSETYLGNPIDRDQYVATLHWNGTDIIVDEPHQNVDYSSADSNYGQIAGGLNDASQGFPYYGLAWPRYTPSSGDVWTGAYYEPPLVTNTCFGDGTGSFCPCGNTGAPGHGCANSVTSGALLDAVGPPFLSADGLVLVAANLPPTAACLFFQSTGIGSTGTVFGDGLRCIIGTTLRIATRTATNGVALYPAAGETPISVRAALPADTGTRGYQAWYRNAANFCTPATFNMTNGVRVIWVR